MVIQPLKVSNTVFATNDNRQPETAPQQAKQTFYIPSFKDFLDDLRMEQQEQM